MRALYRKIINITPVVSLVLFELGDVGQIVTLWRSRVTAGQSELAWFMYSFGFVLWIEYYNSRPMVDRLAKYSAAMAFVMNFTIFLTIVYLRRVLHR